MTTKSFQVLRDDIEERIALECKPASTASRADHRPRKPTRPAAGLTGRPMTAAVSCRRNLARLLGQVVVKSSAGPSRTPP
jgi:hypothetical protein